MQNSPKINLRSLSLSEIETFLKSKGEPAYRGKQIFNWIWTHQCKSISEMSNLSKPFREMLSETFEIPEVRVQKYQVSQDKTIKNAFVLPDNNVVEGVLIPAQDRMTACVSSQAGCSLTCKFCATGKLSRIRNLEAFEIFDQVDIIRKQAREFYNQPLTNIVYMGMGEPLLNYSNVLKSIEMICSPEGLNMSPKRITLSTAGIAKMIKKLADDQVKFNLALSLHAANDTKRNEIMPINEHNSLQVLSEALQYFYKNTGNQITLEYIVFDNFNDELQDARELVNFAKKVPCKVNIIEYNPIEDGGFKNAREDKVNAFKDLLEKNRIIVNIRRSRGKDIDAACGQLANKSLK